MSLFLELGVYVITVIHFNQNKINYSHKIYSTPSHWLCGFWFTCAIARNHWQTSLKIYRLADLGKQTILLKR